MRFVLLLLVFSAISSCSGQYEVLIENFKKGIIQNTKTGKYGDKILGTGMHTLTNTERVVIYYVEKTKNETTISVLTKDDLIQKVNVKYEYKIQEKNLLKLNNEIGKSYEESVIVPQIRVWVRHLLRGMKRMNSRAL